MANSNVISELKENIVMAIAKDDSLFYAIDAPDCENGGDLINTHIFRYNKNPDTITKTITFITVMAHTKNNIRNDKFVVPTLEIWVYSHDGHMKMDSKITKDNRNDYISRLLDEKFNGSSEYGGVGTLRLISNSEGTFSSKFLYRRLVFETIDINDSLCG